MLQFISALITTFTVTMIVSYITWVDDKWRPNHYGYVSYVYHMWIPVIFTTLYSSRTFRKKLAQMILSYKFNYSPHFKKKLNQYSIIYTNGLLNHMCILIVIWGELKQTLLLFDSFRFWNKYDEIHNLYSMATNKEAIVSFLS